MNNWTTVLIWVIGFICGFISFWVGLNRFDPIK